MTCTNLFLACSRKLRADWNLRYSSANIPSSEYEKDRKRLLEFGTVEAESHPETSAIKSECTFRFYVLKRNKAVAAYIAIRMLARTIFCMH